MPRNPQPPRGQRPESVLVHGVEPLATSALAVGLASRGRGPVAWADCARARSAAYAPARTWIELRVGPPAIEQVDDPLLRPVNFERILLRHVVAPTEGPDDGRLLNHLALPELFQRLASRAISVAGVGAILLANIDALPEALCANTVGTARLHQTLHEEGLSVLMTSRSSPSTSLGDAFDRIFRVDGPEGARWDTAWLTEEKGTTGPGARPPVQLRAAWARLGLEPSLFPSE